MQKSTNRKITWPTTRVLGVSTSKAVFHVSNYIKSVSGELKVGRGFTIFTGRNEVVAKVMFLLVSVILLTPQEDGYCCGRYASYWNAFLLLYDFSKQREFIYNYSEPRTGDDKTIRHGKSKGKPTEISERPCII